MDVFPWAARKDRCFMASRTDPRLVREFKICSHIASLGALAVCALVLAGWAFDLASLKSFIPNLPTMKVRNAAALALAGIGLWILQGESGNSRRRIAGQVLAGLAGLFGLLTLSEYFFGWHLAIAPSLFRDPPGIAGIDLPGRTAPQAGACLVLIAVALLTLDSETDRGWRPAQWLSLAVVLTSTLTLLGFLYGVSALYQSSSHIAVSFPTALALLILSLGILSARPERGVMRPLVSQSPGGVLARQLAPAVMSVPFLLGWLRLLGEQRGLYGRALGLALFASANVVVFAFLVWRSIATVDQMDSERQQAEAASRRSETGLAEAQRLAHLGTWEWDVVKDRAWWSEEMYRIFGLDPSRITPTLENSLKCMHPDDRGLVEAALKESFEQQKPYNIDYRIVRPDGAVRFVHAQGEVSYDYDHRPVRMVGIVQDVSEQTQAEEALRESEARYRVLFERNLAGIVQASKSGVVLNCNESFARIFGFASREEALGQSLQEFRFDPADRAAFIAGLQQAGTLRDVELHLRRRDGREIWILENLSLVKPTDGGEPVVEATVFDITDRKRTEEENARLNAAIEQSVEAVLITDTQGIIHYVNPAFERITGYGREEALGKNPRFLRSGLQDSTFYERLWKTILDGRVWHGEVVNRRKDGRLYTEEMNIAPVRNASGEITHFIATKQDVTARKELEQQLQQAQKMEAIGRLAGGVAHDFNNLLTIINGYSQMLVEGLEASDTLRNQVAEILKAGERAAGLTQQLLAFSRRQVLNMQVLDLNQVVTETHKMLHRLVGEDIECRTALHPELWRVKADSGQITQILMNLAVNARDAMPQGGTLTIETSNVNLDSRYAATHAEVTPGRYAVLAVSDTGVGMSRETQAHIFEPFFTTKEQGKGTGLGLATVYGIVRQSGGYIWVYSEPGRGATFKIYLPSVEGEVEAKGPGGERRKSYDGTETVLMVEDEAAVRGLVAEVLRRHGYQVLAASNPEEAAQISSGYAKTIHLLLTDLVMPKWSGRQLAEHLAFSRPDMKVLFMSGYTDDTVIRQGNIREGTPFLQKPFTPENLVRRVRGVLDT